LGCPRKVVILCFVLLWGRAGVTQDANLAQVAAILKQADVISRGVEGEFAVYCGECSDECEVDFEIQGLKLESKGNVSVNSANAVVEFLGGTESTFVGTGSRYNDLSEVIARSDDTYFEYQTIGSTLTPYANLRIHRTDTSQAIMTRLNTNVLDYFKAVTELNGFPIESWLVVPECVVEVDSTKGQYAISAQHHDAINPATLKYDLTVTGSAVKCRFEMTSGANGKKVIAQSLVEADFDSQSIVPRRVGRKLSGPGWGAARREVMLFTPKIIDTMDFPISEKAFRRYERDYPVARGDETQSKEYVYAVPENRRMTLQDRLDISANLPPERGDPPMESSWSRRQLFIVANAIVLIVFFAWLRRRSQRNG